MSGKPCTISPVRIDAIDNLTSDQSSLLRAADSFGNEDGAVTLREFDQYAGAVRNLTADFHGTRNALVGALQVPIGQIGGLNTQERSVLDGADQASDGNGKVSVQELHRYMPTVLTTADPQRLEDAIRDAVVSGCSPKLDQRSFVGKVVDTVVEIFTLGMARTKTWG